MEAWRNEYPFASHHLDVGGGVRLHYLDEGPRGDEAVVMLHGNPTWSFHFRRLILALRGQLRCVVPDHIGMGLSDKPAGYAYRLDQRIADVAKLVAHLGLRRIHLVLHDWGGAVGFGLATRQTDRVGRIVAMNTAAFPDRHIPRAIALCRVPWLGALLVRGGNAFVRAALVRTVTRPLAPEVRAGYLAPYDSWANRVAVHGFVLDIPMQPSHPSFESLQQIEAHLPWLRAKPLLFGWGERDFCFTPHFLARWQTIFPAARFERFPEAGHYLLEDAGEAFIPQIRSFLTP